MREKLYARSDTDESGELPGGNGEGMLVAGADTAARVNAGDHRRTENFRSEDARGRVGRGAYDKIVLHIECFKSGGLEDSSTITAVEMFMRAFR